MNDRWCVRCGRQGPTPFLRKHIGKLGILTQHKDSVSIADIGCGNGRNTEYLKSLGFSDILSLDMAGDYGFKITLGKDRLPIFTQSADTVLANYVMMFLSKDVRLQLMREIHRILRVNGSVMFELYPAKDSYTPTEADCDKLQRDIIRYMNSLNEYGYETIVENKHKFILGRR